MTFIIGSNGVENTEGTEATFGSGGSVHINGSFKNSGNVNVDTRANLNVLGDIANSGTFNIRDFVNEEKYKVFENAINDLSGDAKNFANDLYLAVQNNNSTEAQSKLSQLVSYLKAHPEIITSSVQILLQIFLR